MSKNDMENLANATMMSVGIIQGAYMKFLEENNGDRDVAIRLTKIAWDGLMLSVRTNNEDDNKLF